MAGINIERYFNEDCLIAPLKAIGASRQMVAREGLTPHYENYYEVHLILDGTVNWWVESEQYTLQPGSVFLTKPGEVHGSLQDLVEPCTLNWLQVDAGALYDPSIENDLATISTRHWHGAGALFDYISLMLAEVRHPKADSQRVLSAYLHLFLVQLIRQEKSPASQPIFPKAFTKLLHFIETSVSNGTPVSMEALGAESGLSRSRLFQLFDQHVGQSPISYSRSLRIRHSRTLLKQPDIPITEIAHKLGFSSSQHFATVFKRITGVTPREYRKKQHTLPKEFPELTSVTSTKGHLEST